MDLDLSIIGSVLSQDGAFSYARRYGVTSKILKGKGADLWSFIIEHFVEYGSIPTQDFFQAKNGIQVPEAHEDIKVLVDDLKKRALWEKSLVLHENMGQALDKQEPVLPMVGEFLSDVYKSDITGQKVGNLLALGHDVWDLYSRMKNGERGILTPWEAMDDMTLGFWPGDFIVFVARVSVGKTFSMLLLARKAWMDGKKVLFVGTEMNRVRLAMRFFSIHLNLPYADFRRGRLATPVESRAEEAIRLMTEQKGLDIVGDDFDADINQIVSAVEQTRPDILFVDGLYLVKNEGKDRHTRVSNTADDLKRLAKRIGIPIITSTQFNREVSSNTRSGISASNVGISDVIAWNCDVMFGQFQTDDMKEDKLMGFQPLKLREGRGREFYVKWDFEEMDFSQAATGDEVSGKFEDNYDGIPYDGVGIVGSDDDGAIF